MLLLKTFSKGGSKGTRMAFTGFPGRGRGGSSWLSFSDLSAREATSIRTPVAVRAPREARRLRTCGWGWPRASETKPRGSPLEGLPRNTDGAPGTGGLHCPFPATSPGCKRREPPHTCLPHQALGLARLTGPNASECARPVPLPARAYQGIPRSFLDRRHLGRLHFLLRLLKVGD